jgi:hypothetical protein
MSDFQPASDDVVICQVRSGYIVGQFTSVSSHEFCATDVAALQAAHLHARHARVDVWYTDDDTMWRVKRYRPTDELPAAAMASS